MKQKHKKDCYCFVCMHGMEAFQKKNKEAIEKYGFVVHFVPDDNKFPNRMNIHTHGVAESFQHMDLQICFRINENQALGILHNIVNLIKEGKTFFPNIEYEQILNGYRVKFIEAREGGRPVLRCILPNKDGNYTGQPFTEQFFMTGL